MSLFSLPILDRVLDVGMDIWKQDKAEDMQQHAQNFGASQSAAQMAFQERMRSSQYQTAVGDMKAAGLNPMLAYHQGGAGTPPGASATSPGGALPAAQRSRLTSDFQSAAQIDLLNKQTENIAAQTSKTKAEEGEIIARTPTHAANIQLTRQRVEEAQAHIETLLQQARTGAASAANLEQQTRNLKEIIPQIHATIKLLHAQAQQTGAQTGLTKEQTREVTQRIKQNLPEIERAIRDLEAKARNLEMPRRGMEAAANDSYIGALGAVLRALNPLSSLTNIGR